MKKLIFFVLIFAMALSLVACGGGSGSAAKSVKEIKDILTAEGWTPVDMTEDKLGMSTSVTAKEGVEADKSEAEGFEGVTYVMMANKEDAQKFLKEGPADFGLATEAVKSGLGDEHIKAEMMGIVINFVRKGQHVAIFTGLDLDTIKPLAKKMGL